MKKIITLGILLMALTSTKAQIGNPSFENWELPLLNNSFNVTGSISGITFYVCAPNFTYHEPTKWSSTNQLTNTPAFGTNELVTESSTAYAGTKSVRIESKDLTITAYLAPGCFALPYSLNNVAPGLIVNGSFNLNPQNLIDEIVGGSGLNALNPFTYPGVGEAINFIPKSISGYYQYSGMTDPATGALDSCIVVSGLKKNGVLIGHVVTRLGNAASWTEFKVDYSHLSCEIPDTIITVISSSSIDLEIVNNEFVINSDFTGVNGSVMMVDAIHIDTINLAEFPPLLVADEATTFIESTVTINVLANDEFCDMATYAPIILVGATNGTTNVNASNEVEYTPNSGYTGTENLTYYICNSASVCDTTSITISVVPVSICYANDDTRTLDLGVMSTDNFMPKANDVDCGSVVTLVPGSGPSIGTAQVESNNSITYSPNNSAGGSDLFKYYVCSLGNPNQCDTASVIYTVISGINDLPANAVSFYPNPAKTNLTVKVDMPGQVTVTIFNTLGAKMISESFYASQIIDLSTLNNGLYFAEIAVDGKKSIRKFQVIK